MPRRRAIAVGTPIRAEGVVHSYMFLIRDGHLMACGYVLAVSQAQLKQRQASQIDCMACLTLDR